MKKAVSARLRWRMSWVFVPYMLALIFLWATAALLVFATCRIGDEDEQTLCYLNGGFVVAVFVTLGPFIVLYPRYLIAKDVRKAYAQGPNDFSALDTGGCRCERAGSRAAMGRHRRLRLGGERRYRMARTARERGERERWARVRRETERRGSESERARVLFSSTATTMHPPLKPDTLIHDHIPQLPSFEFHRKKIAKRTNAHNHTTSPLDPVQKTSRLSAFDTSPIAPIRRSYPPTVPFHHSEAHLVPHRTELEMRASFDGAAASTSAGNPV